MSQQNNGADSPLFFDNWSDGPFTYEAVAEMVAKNPEVANKFHTDGNVSFADYCEQEGRGEV